MGKLEHQSGEELGQQMGQQVPPGNGQPGHPQLFRRTDIHRAPQLEHLTPDDPGQRGPVAEGHACHHAYKSLAECQRDEHDQQDMGDTHDQIDAPGDHRVHPAPQDRGSHTQHQGNDGADSRGQEADADTEGQARQGAGEHIPAHPVGSEEELPAGGQIFAGKVGNHSLAAEQAAGHCHSAQHHSGGSQQKEGIFSPVPMSHFRATPLLILGSTTP